MKGEIIPPGGALGSEIDVATPFELETLERFRIQRSRTVEGCFGMGEVLCEVKQRLEHGRWLLWLESAQAHPRTAQMLMSIYADLRLQGLRSESDSLLPPAQGTLYLLSALPDDQFEGLVEGGKIHPEMTRADLKTAIAAHRHADSAPPALDSLPHGKWRAILADPPWQFETWGKGNDRAPENHYPTMSLTAIELLPIMNIAADDAVLFLWVTSDRIKDAPRIMVQWGFDLVSTAFVWVKEGPAGLGYWTRKGAEICLLGKRGNPKRLSGGVEEVVVAPRGPHSRKPPEIRERIEALVPGPYVELFARDVREGWDAWGNHPGLGDG